MTTLENLYYGNIAPHEYEVVRGSEYDITAKLVIRHEQELSATLTGNAVSSKTDVRICIIIRFSFVFLIHTSSVLKIVHFIIHYSDTFFINHTG